MVVKGSRSVAVATLLTVAVLCSVAFATPPANGAVSTPWPGGRWQPDAAQYGMTVVKNVPVKMDDGVTLFADVGYPTDRATGERAAGKFPVLVSQNPYAGGGTPDSFFVSRGYIYAVADVRGTNRTEAPNNGPLVFDLFSPREAKDGAELVTWAAGLSGSNGIVGLTGCSFLGINQIFTAAAVGPKSPLAAILPACASNGYDVYFSGGIPTAIAGLFSGTGSIVGTKHIVENQANGKKLSDDILSGGPRAYNGAFWQARTTANVLPTIVRNGIPALLWSGWRATELVGVLDEYAVFQNAYAKRPVFGPMAADQTATGRYQVIVGSGEHGSGLDQSIELEWFDRWLKNDRNGIDETSTPMHLNEMQSGRWINGADYPIVKAYTPYYLSSGGELTATAPSPGSQTVTWGVPSTNGTSVSYTSPAFTKSMTLTGPTSVNVTASSSNTNMELLATLSDVAPNGNATTITHGALIGSMRKTDPNATWQDVDHLVIKPSHPYARDEYLQPGEKQQFDIGLLPITWAIKPGHSLRLTVATQADAANCKITLTPLPQAWPCLLTTPQKQSLPGGKYQLTYGGSDASLIALPLVESSALPAVKSGVTATSAKTTEPLDWGHLTASASRPTANPAPSATSNSSSSSSGWIWIVVAIAVVAAIAGGVILLRRRRAVS